MDDPMQASMAADLEVERRLNDFARGRLTPSAASKARSRARVMREARLAFADQPAGPAAATATTDLAVVRARNRRAAMRRGMALLAAAVLSLAVVGGALAASGAGGPLYGVRIWVETVTLPSDPGARASAELARLESRLAEVQAAVRKGDRVAAAAALAAYQQIADEALAGAGTDQAAIDKLIAALNRHVAVLERVAGQVPPQAAASIQLNIEKAISHNDAAIQRIEAGSNGNGDGAGSGPAGGDGAQPGAGPAAKPDPTSNAEPTPAPTPKASPPGHAPHETAAPAGGSAGPTPTPKSPPGKASARPEKTPGKPGG
jgi:hypothetical protein